MKKFLKEMGLAAGLMAGAMGGKAEAHQAPEPELPEAPAPESRAAGVTVENPYKDVAEVYTLADEILSERDFLDVYMYAVLCKDFVIKKTLDDFIKERMPEYDVYTDVLTKSDLFKEDRVKFIRDLCTGENKEATFAELRARLRGEFKKIFRVN